MIKTYLCQKLSRIWKEMRIAETIEAFDKAIELNEQNAAAWFYKGIALSTLGRYAEAKVALQKSINIDPSNPSAITAIGEICFELGDLGGASQKIKEALAINEKSVEALTLQGKIAIDEKRYQGARAAFSRALFCCDCTLNNFQLRHNIHLLLLDSYAKSLDVEFVFNPKNKKYQEEIASIIRSLEKAYELSKKQSSWLMKEEQAYILYYLGGFYLKAQDVFKAKEKLLECVKLKSRDRIKASAEEILDYVWNYQLRPSLWRWWLSSPLRRWQKRIICCTLLLYVYGLVMVPQFSSEFLRLFYPFKVTDQTLYYLQILMFGIVLLLPVLRRIKAKDIEVELLTPLPFDPAFSPSAMQEVVSRSNFSGGNLPGNNSKSQVAQDGANSSQ